MRVHCFVPFLPLVSTVGLSSLSFQRSAGALGLPITSTSRDDELEILNAKNSGVCAESTSLISWQGGIPPYQVVVAVVAGLDGTRRIPTILALQQTAETSLCIDIPQDINSNSFGFFAVQSSDNQLKIDEVHALDGTVSHQGTTGSSSFQPSYTGSFTGALSKAPTAESTLSIWSLSTFETMTAQLSESSPTIPIITGTSDTKLSPTFASKDSKSEFSQTESIITSTYDDTQMISASLDATAPSNLTVTISSAPESNNTKFDLIHDIPISTTIAKLPDSIISNQTLCIFVGDTDSSTWNDSQCAPESTGTGTPTNDGSGMITETSNNITTPTQTPCPLIDPNVTVTNNQCTPESSSTDTVNATTTPTSITSPQMSCSTSPDSTVTSIPSDDQCSPDTTTSTVTPTISNSSSSSSPSSSSSSSSTTTQTPCTFVDTSTFVNTTINNSSDDQCITGPNSTTPPSNTDTSSFVAITSIKLLPGNNTTIFKGSTMTILNTSTFTTSDTTSINITQTWTTEKFAFVTMTSMSLSTLTSVSASTSVSTASPPSREAAEIEAEVATRASRVIGIVLGALAALVFILLLVIFLMRRRYKRSGWRKIEPFVFSNDDDNINTSKPDSTLNTGDKRLKRFFLRLNPDLPTTRTRATPPEQVDIGLYDPDHHIISTPRLELDQELHLPIITLQSPESCAMNRLPDSNDNTRTRLGAEYHFLHSGDSNPNLGESSSPSRWASTSSSLYTRLEFGLDSRLEFRSGDNDDDSGEGNDGSSSHYGHFPSDEANFSNTNRSSNRIDKIALYNSARRGSLVVRGPRPKLDVGRIWTRRETSFTLEDCDPFDNRDSDREALISRSRSLGEDRFWRGDRHRTSRGLDQEENGDDWEVEQTRLMEIGQLLISGAEYARAETTPPPSYEVSMSGHDRE
ncbi:hypothetical protein VKT23_000290 [Stygiomarasmius scandens]|uniref:Mid2 domain-containing protein n=1 Tax=Marasmiellus scandens TaxID=2682957 RepID=A0ABR1K3M6_9AGAR